MRFALAASVATGALCACLSAYAAGGGACAGGGVADARHYFDDAALRHRRRRQEGSGGGDQDQFAKQIEREHSPNIVDSLAKNTPSVDVQTVTGNDFQPDVFSAASTLRRWRARRRGSPSIRTAFVSTKLSATRELGSHSDGRGQEHGRHQQQSRLWPQRARRRDLDEDEGRLQFSGDDARPHGRLLRPRAGLAAVGKAGRTLGRLYRHRGCARQRLSPIRRLGPFAASTATSATRRDSGEFHINIGARRQSVRRGRNLADRTAERRWKNVYTTPQTSLNQVGYVNATANVNVTPTWSVQAHAHVRTFYQSTQDGNPTNVQPCADPALLCFNDAVTPANGLNGQQLANTFPANATLGEIDIHAHPDDQRRRDLAGDQHGQTVRPRQPFRGRRQLRLWRHELRRRRRPRRHQAQLRGVGLRHLPRAVGQPGRRRAGLAAHDQRLYRPLRARRVRCDRQAHRFRRRPLQQRQYHAAGPARLVAQRQRRLHALQSDDRRDLQDHARASRPTPVIPKPTARRRRWSSAAPTRSIPAFSRPSSSPIRRCNRSSRRPSRRACAARTISARTAIVRLEARRVAHRPQQRHREYSRSLPDRASAISRTSARRGEQGSKRRSATRTTG